MLRSSFMEDPFFSGADDHMRQMDHMFNQDFGQVGRRNRLAISQGRKNQQRAQNMQVAQQDMFMDPFAHFNNMFSNMHSMMADMRSAFDGVQPTGDGHVYQQSSFMSYSNTGNGPPRMYQASTSSQHRPGGVRETRKTLRDSESGIDKIAVGHHIKDRGHVIERMRNNRTGNINENQEYINLGEDEVTSFDEEYCDKWQSPTRGLDQRRHTEHSRHGSVATTRRCLALPEPEVRRHRKSHRKE